MRHSHAQGWRVAVLVPMLAALMPAGLARGQGADPARNNQEEHLGQAAFEVVKQGVDLYNTKRDVAGCYWLYRGSLQTYVPLLSGHPLRAKAVAALKNADAQPDLAAKANALRPVLDELAKLRKPVKPESLWARLGGEPAVTAVVHDFIFKAADNPKVDFTRGGKYPLDAAGVANLERLLVELVSAVSGGPLKYTGRDMPSSHAGMGITEAQFGALAGDLIAVLKQYNVPQKEIDELVGIIATTKKDIAEQP